MAEHILHGGLIFMLAVCAGCKPRTAQKTPAPANERPRSKVVELPDPLRRIAPDKEVRSAKSSQTRLTYQIPQGCKLRYEVDATVALEPADEERGDMLPDLVVRQAFEMSRGGPADFEIDWGPIEMAHRTRGGESPARTQKPGTLAKTWLEATDDGALVEVEGPTAAWSAYGSFAGPVVFFPKLPRSGGVSWAPPTHAHGSGLGVEAKRGATKLEGREPPEPVPSSASGTAAIEQWVEIDGRRAALIRAKWDSEGSSDQPDTGATMDASSDGGGLYLVSEDGRLLIGHVGGTAKVDMKYRAISLAAIVDTDATIRLVKGCGPDGVAFERPLAMLDPAEQATTLLERHRGRLAARDWEAAAEDYAREVLDVHGDEVAKVLKAHFTKYGADAFGDLSTARVVRRGDDKVRVEFDANPIPSGDSERRVRGPVYAEVRITADGPRISGIYWKHAWSFFEVSERRVHSRVRPYTQDGQTEQEAMQLLCDAPLRCDIRPWNIGDTRKCVDDDIKVNSIRDIIKSAEVGADEEGIVGIDWYRLMSKYANRFGVEDCHLARRLGDVMSFEKAFERMCEFAHDCPVETDGFAKCLKKEIPDNFEIRHRFAVDSFRERLRQIKHAKRERHLLRQPIPDSCQVIERWEAHLEKFPEPEPPPRPVVSPEGDAGDSKIVDQVTF